MASRRESSILSCVDFISAPPKQFYEFKKLPDNTFSSVSSASYHRFSGIAARKSLEYSLAAGLTKPGSETKMRLDSIQGVISLIGEDFIWRKLTEILSPGNG